MDPRKLPQVMVSTAQQRGLDAVLRTITDGIAQCPNTVLTRIWLATPNYLCKVCRGRDDASDHSRWLHLVASAGVPRDPQADYGRLDGAFHRFPMGERKIGRVAATGEPLRLAGLRGDEEWIADSAWFVHEGVRTFAAQPLIFRDDVLGVLALFDRGLLDEEAFEWLRIFADYAAVSIANARAFDEISLLRTRLEEENLYLREEVTAALGMGEFIGESQALQHVLRQVQLVAPTDAAVLITGESGTGKELVARAIHDRSPRQGRALIKVNCSAVPDALFESEFFGHVKGPSPVRSRIDRAVSKWLIAGRSFSTKSGKCRWRCRRSYCVYFRRENSNALAIRAHGQWMSGSSRRPIATLNARSKPVIFEKTSTIVSACSRSTFRRSVNAVRTSRSWRCISSLRAPGE
ncbi:hypothetical protein NITMOv2_4242 [Nitrospira moscoviensis]|uniref:Sigma-54 factor interaction domain-containing protein n=1 Tax=Nitrospira moscoviensis TaxID=42253 RepID=A0A0K2GI49_NITMO|nr:sigma 54-interacting transcriptional regulator [Nitrospira moscoviensis]ALA60620.1 hypothetical protein NITMOv2_4242 [Nitrospira moscoviensis]